MRRQEIIEASRNVLTAIQQSQLITAVTRVYELARRRAAEEGPSPLDDDLAAGILTVIIPAVGDERSSPARLIAVLESIQVFYETYALITDTPAGHLAVVGCDSGSDTSFDFLGVAKVIESVKDFILSMW